MHRVTVRCAACETSTCGSQTSGLIRLLLQLLLLLIITVINVIRIDLLAHREQQGSFENSGKPLGGKGVQLLAQVACECPAAEV